MADNSATIAQTYAIRFKNDFIIRVQQKTSRLEKSVRNDPEFLEGKYGYYDRIGPTTYGVKTTRHPPTPVIATQYDRRRILRSTLFYGDIVDRSDIERQMKDPTSRVKQNGVYAFYRSVDDYIIRAATGPSWAIDQNDNATSVPLPASNIIGQDDGAALNLTKVLTSMEGLDGNEVDDEEERYFVTNAHGITQMLNTTQTTNQYYLQIQQLKEGKIDFFAKFPLDQEPAPPGRSRLPDDRLDALGLRATRHGGDPARRALHPRHRGSQHLLQLARLSRVGASVPSGSRRSASSRSTARRPSACSTARTAGCQLAAGLEQPEVRRPPWPS